MLSYQISSLLVVAFLGVVAGFDLFKFILGVVGDLLLLVLLLVLGALASVDLEAVDLGDVLGLCRFGDEFGVDLGGAGGTIKRMWGKEQPK